MKIIYSSLLAGVVLFAACSSSKKLTNTSLVNYGKVWASIYQQQAAEYKALCFQAYNIAKLRLDVATQQTSSKPYAVVTDLDETVFDNSPYDAKRAINNLGYENKTWKDWTAKGIADTVPGAPAFFKFAAAKNVEVFYITNRDEDERAGTLTNLKLYGLPYADDAHLIMRHGGASKEGRRQDVLKTHNIILLCGDNLADFDALYDNKPTEENRTTSTQKLMAEFGSRYIVLPNPEYGDWESSLFNFNYKLTDAQKDSIIKAQIKLEK